MIPVWSLGWLAVDILDLDIEVNGELLAGASSKFEADVVGLGGDAARWLGDFWGGILEGDGAVGCGDALGFCETAAREDSPVDDVTYAVVEGVSDFDGEWVGFLFGGDLGGRVGGW